MPEKLDSSPGQLTRQRKLVWDIVKDSREHLDVKTIYLIAQTRNPFISQATVYRSLTFLKNAGLVNELNLGESHHHYEAMHATPHEHFTCLKCGKLIELETSQFYELARRICTEQGLKITHMDLLLSGYCQECAMAESRK